MKSLKQEIIDAAKEVYKTLGSGHDEDIYHNALVIEIRLKGISYEKDKPLEVKYKGYGTGILFADIYARHENERILVEIKAMEPLTGSLYTGSIQREINKAQHYSRMMGLPEITSALLINFPYPAIFEPEVMDLEKFELI